MSGSLEDLPGPRPVMDPAATYRRQVPVSKLRAFLTPTEDVYVIAHMGIAHVPVETWELRIEGAVGRPMRLTKEVKVGFSKNLPEYPFPVWDPERIITVPVQAMTAPPDCPKPGTGHDDPSATVNWIKTTWPTSS